MTKIEEAKEEGQTGVNLPRRSFLKTGVAGGASVVALRVAGGIGITGIAAMLAACGENVLTWLSVIIRTVGEAGALFGELGLPKGVEIAGKIAAVAKKIDAAIRGKNFDSALDFLNEIIRPSGLFDQILEIAGIAKSKAISSALVIVKFALNIIAGIIEGNLKAAPLTMRAIAGDPRLQHVRKWAELDADAVLGIKP